MNAKVSSSLSTGIPQLSKRKVWYILPAGYTDTGFLNDWGDGVRMRYYAAGYDFIFINEMCDFLKPYVLSYNIPEADLSDLVIDRVIPRLENALGQTIECPTVIRFSGSSARGGSVDIYEFPEGPAEGSFAERALERITKAQDGETCFSFAELEEADFSFLDFSDEKRSKHVVRCRKAPSSLIDNAGAITGIPARSINVLPDSREMAELCRHELFDAEQKDERSEAEIAIERIIDHLKEMNEKELRRIGLDEQALRFLAGKTAPKYSVMRITRNARILLEDYHGRVVNFDDKTKALYFLYLRHPEGIAIKELPSHTEELLDLYKSISGRDDQVKMRLTITNLVDPYQNNANVSLSRIKRAFAEEFCSDIAKAYYVDGDRGGLRRVSLDRGLVIWDTIR